MMRIVACLAVIFLLGCQKEEDNKWAWMDAKCTCLPEPYSYEVPVTFKDYEGKTVSVKYTIGWKDSWRRYQLHPRKIYEVKAFTPEETIHHYSFHEPQKYKGTWSIYCSLQDKRFNYSTAVPIKFHYIDVTTPDQYDMIDHEYVRKYFYKRTKVCRRHKERD